MKKHTVALLLPALLTASLGMLPPLASARGDGQAARSGERASELSSEEHAFGRQGDPKKSSRTIVIDMSDNMRFTPDQLTVKQGETIRFIVKNRGKMLHEMVIGTMEELKAHHAMMQKHPGMEHEAPYSVHVSAGKKGTIVWQFTQPGEFYFACLLPGHLEAGMIGKINVVKG